MQDGSVGLPKSSAFTAWWKCWITDIKCIYWHLLSRLLSMQASIKGLTTIIFCGIKFLNFNRLNFFSFPFKGGTPLHPRCLGTFEFLHWGVMGTEIVFSLLTGKFGRFGIWQFRSSVGGDRCTEFKPVHHIYFTLWYICPSSNVLRYGIWYLFHKSEKWCPKINASCHKWTHSVNWTTRISLNARAAVNLVNLL